MKKTSLLYIGWAAFGRHLGAVTPEPGADSTVYGRLPPPRLGGTQASDRPAQAPASWAAPAADLIGSSVD